VARRDVHSFPTRRSSDLALRLGGIPRLGGAVLRRRPNLLLALLVVPLLLFVAIVFLWPVLRFLWLSVDNTDISSSLGRTTAALRSEEHTSELQSREKLVC